MASDAPTTMVLDGMGQWGFDDGRMLMDARKMGVR